ncbi:HypC/HybG/HupF family hydrogenase formation chaperone [Haliangium sp.]|uniref:HypC/HybG/HupF family hydrogenase formation chaperone n=1 Tax=Haliangium sp. TaxID=2663208 RepID=UPI003D099256
MCLGLPGRIVSITGADALTRTARAEIDGVVKEVNLACVPEAEVGDYVLIHVGLAISIISAVAAERQLDELRRVVDSHGPSSERAGEGAEPEGP